MAERQGSWVPPSSKTKAPPFRHGGVLHNAAANDGNDELAGAHHSKYIGVTWHRKDKRFQAAIKIKGKSFHLGQYLDETEAARKYDERAAELGRRLNFERSAEEPPPPSQSHDGSGFKVGLPAVDNSSASSDDSNSNPYAKLYPQSRESGRKAKVQVLSTSSHSSMRNGPGNSSGSDHEDGPSSGQMSIRNSGMKTLALVHALEAGSSSIPPQYLNMVHEDVAASGSSFLLDCFEEPFVHDLRAIEDDSSISSTDDRRFPSRDDL